MPYVGTSLADAELFVRNFLATQFSPIRVVTETPADLVGACPLIEVVRFGGSDDVFVLDAANIDVDCYDVTRQGAINLAGQVRSALRMRLPGFAASGAACQSVSTLSAPRWVPYDNTNVRRISAAYRITIHSIPS